MEFQIQRFDEVSSTNTLLKEYAAKDAKEGLVLTAEFQTGGRGKPGNTWISPKGKDLLFSILLRPPLAPSKAPILTQIACRTVAKVLKDPYQIDSAFKRPNDILVKGKKICGVLVEAASSSDQTLNSVVIGIGLNVNSKSSELVPGTTSMRDESENGKEIDRNKLLERILTQFELDIVELYAYK